MNYTIENIKETLETKYLNNLCLICQKQSINYTHLENKIKKKDINNKVIKNTNSSETDMLTESTDYLYIKPWVKLNQIHKIIKIKEFINNININEKEKEILIENILELLKDKTKKNKIIYDSEKGKIISISCLKFENGKYLI